MYGLVNNGVRNFVLEGHGPETWAKICAAAGVPDEPFENLNAYEDAVTGALVAAVSDELGVSPAQALEVFGTYWVGFSKSTAIGKLITQRADTLIERIRGLDAMHAQVQMTMPHLDPPSFDFEECDDGNHRLHYISSRDGLAPMVVGLLKGMAEECGVEIDVTHDQTKADGADHDVFGVRIMGVAAPAA